MVLQQCYSGQLGELMAGEKSPPHAETAFSEGRSGLSVPEFKPRHPDNPAWDILNFFRNLWKANERDASVPTIESSQQINRMILLPATETQPETLLKATVTRTPPSPLEEVLPVVMRTLARRVDDHTTHAGLQSSWRTGEEVYGVEVADEQGVFQPYFRLIKGRYSTSFSRDGGENVPPGIEIEGERIERIPTQRPPDEYGPMGSYYYDMLLEAMERLEHLLAHDPS